MKDKEIYKHAKEIAGEFNGWQELYNGINDIDALMPNMEEEDESRALKEHVASLVCEG